MDSEERKQTMFVFGFYGIIAISTLVTIAAVWPVYSIWSSRKSGEAQLAQAESNRKIVICEAQARNLSEKELCEARITRAHGEAEAEIIRARGVAEANKIIGESLQGNEAYLRYRWIEGLQTNQMQVVYVPTEAGLPVLEAGKR